MTPPECYFESARRKPVEAYAKLEHWSDKSLFKKLIRELRDTFSANGVLIYIVESQRTVIKVETGLGIGVLPRKVSIDGHAILSQGYFLLLDASKDWRTSRNPLVTGSPSIKFYCGVPFYTAKKELVGVLAIFDTSLKQAFPEDLYRKLQNASKRLTSILETPLADLRKQYSNNSLEHANPVNPELTELSMKLGRATSTKPLVMTVFEKDGSGGPYWLNCNFRFSSLVRETESDDESTPVEGIDNRLLWKKLYGVRSMKNAAMILTKSLCIHYGFDFGYIMEIRIAEPFRIPIECFPKSESKIDVENYRYADRLVKDINLETEFMSRIVGIHGSPHASLNFENAIHQHAFMSEFGIEYKSSKSRQLYNKGIILPFYRHSSKLVRKKRQQQNHHDKLEVYLRSDGYLLGLFNVDPDVEYSTAMVSAIFTNTSNLRKIYISV